MLLELSVENIAVIERAHLALGPGLTAMTGETGAGKSLLVDAIALALGERADSALLRTGAGKAVVSFVVDLTDDERAFAAAEELGLTPEEGRLYVQRELSADGRSQARVNGIACPLSTLRALGDLLVDLHGQHEHQALYDSRRHREYLDAFIGRPAATLVDSVAQLCQLASSHRKRLELLESSLQHRAERLDLLRFQIEELRGAGLQIGETEQLRARLVQLQNSERLQAAARGALELLGDGETNARDLAAAGLSMLESASRMDPALQALVDELRGSLVGLQDALPALRSYAAAVEGDPEQLEQVSERLELLKRLQRKYGSDERAMLQHLATAESELEALSDAEFTGESARLELKAALEALEARSRELTEIRREASLTFGEQVQSQFEELAMPGARFSVNMSPQPCDESGADRIEFLFSANAGEEPKPLAKIASGGEASRAMLAIKTALAGRAGVGTLIFDEVEAGLSGRAAALVGKKLQELAANRQVIVISHLPQIAGRAQTHYRIEKWEVAGRAHTQIKRLNDEQRIEELARMLAGEEVGQSAFANAKELLMPGG